MRPNPLSPPPNWKLLNELLEDSGCRLFPGLQLLRLPPRRGEGVFVGKREAGRAQGFSQHKGVREGAGVKTKRYLRRVMRVER
jgi:hypothetical protein